MWAGAAAIFITLSLLVFLLQQLNFDDAVARGLIIPDVVNITNTLELLWASGEFLQQENQFMAISMIYGWTWLVHPSLCFLVNLVLIVGSIVIFKRTAKNYTNAQGWLIVGVLANPYLVLAMSGPNKEIPLLFLTICYFDLIKNRSRGWVLISVALCFIVFLLRDGYGVFLFLSLLLILVLRHRDYMFAPIMCTLLAIAASMYGILSSIIPILSRNSEIFESISTEQVAIGAFADSFNLNPYSPLDGILLFVLRLFYNLVSLSLFPVLKTVENDIYWIGFSYWISGLMIFSSISAIIINTFNKKIVENRLPLAVGLTLGVFFVVGISLFVQPRYLMPILPIAFLAVSAAPVRLRYFVVLSSIIIALGVMVINRSLDRSPPSANPEQFEIPAYIW